MIPRTMQGRVQLWGRCVVVVTCWAMLTLNLPSVSALQPFQCVNFPPFPLNGKLKISGRFDVRITCPSPDTDLPLNAPGESGVLSCDPLEENYKFDAVSVPECLPLKVPTKLYLPFDMSYTLHSCNESDVTALKNHVTEIRDKLLEGSEFNCGVACHWTQMTATCDENLIFAENGVPSQADINFGLHKDYTNKVSVERYLDEAERIKDLLLLSAEDFADVQRRWGVPDASLERVEVESWVSSCEQHLHTAGTKLATHRIASCRGCPVSYFFEQMSSSCVQCPYGYMTKGPFSSDCEVCPPEAEWGADRKKMIKLCYSRV